MLCKGLTRCPTLEGALTGGPQVMIRVGIEVKLKGEKHAKSEE
jgi:hypothetical protein